jgi:hypothetical protein
MRVEGRHEMTEKGLSREILLEVQELLQLHEKTSVNPSKCREFNARAALLLNRLEELEQFPLADRMMDLLSGCSPKDFSSCDNNQRTKGALERLIARISDDLG